MKKITTIFAALLLTAIAIAQAPQKMTYQAVVRNNSNALVVSSPIGLKVSLLQGNATGAAVYVETHTTQTNQNGLFDIVIGGGTIISGNYVDSILWGGGPYFLKTEIDPNGSSNYSITMTSELLSVPYSNYAQIAGSVDSQSGIANPGAGSWGYFSIPNNKNKRPKKVTIKYLTAINIDNGTSIEQLDILCQSEWYDGNQDGLGDLFYKVENADDRNGYKSVAGNGFLFNTNKLGQIDWNLNWGNNNTLMQEIMISSTLTDITISSTWPVTITSINNLTYTIVGPWKVLYNIEW
jgi:hypothetical protein